MIKLYDFKDNGVITSELLGEIKGELIELVVAKGDVSEFGNKILYSCSAQLLIGSKPMFQRCVQCSADASEVTKEDLANSLEDIKLNVVAKGVEYYLTGKVS